MSGGRFTAVLRRENDAGVRFTPGRSSDSHVARRPTGGAAASWASGYMPSGAARAAPSVAVATRPPKGLVRARGRARFHAPGPAPWGVAPLQRSLAGRLASTATSAMDSPISALITVLVHASSTAYAVAGCGWPQCEHVGCSRVAWWLSYTCWINLASAEVAGRRPPAPDSPGERSWRPSTRPGWVTNPLVTSRERSRKGVSTRRVPPVSTPLRNCSGTSTSDMLISVRSASCMNQPLQYDLWACRAKA